MRRVETLLLRRALVALLLFTAGEWAAWVAVLVSAFERGGTTLAMLASVAQLSTAAALAPVAAAWASRRAPTLALRGAYRVQTAAMLALGAIVASGGDDIWLVASACCTTAVITLTRPAHFALIGQVVGREGPLARWNGASAAAEGLAILAGPLLAGVLLRVAGAGWAIAAAAGLMALAALTMSATPALAHESFRRPGGGVTAAGGPSDAARHSHTAVIVFACVFGGCFLAGAIDVLAVAFASETLRLGPDASGLLIGALGAGAVLGGAVVSARPVAKHLVGSPLVGVLMTSGPFALVSSSDALPIAVLCLTLAGVGRGVLDTYARTVLQRRCPASGLVVALGTQESVAHAALAVGAAAALPAIDVWGPSVAFAVCAAVLPTLWIGASVLVAVSRRYRSEFAA